MYLYPSFVTATENEKKKNPCGCVLQIEAFHKSTFDHPYSRHNVTADSI